MTEPTRRFRRGLLAAGLMLLASASAPAADPKPGTKPATPVPPALAMQADGAFFEGRIEIKVRLGAGLGRRPAGDEKDLPEPGREGGRPRGGRRGPPAGGPPPGGGGPGGMAPVDDSPAAPGAGRRLRPSASGRPLMLHLTLINHGDQPATVEVADFNSALGNFVVLPARFRLEPGAAAEAEPMTSRLGNAAAEVPLTVRLRLAGKAEQQILTLKVVAPGEGAPAPNAAAAEAAAQPPKS